MLNNWRDNNGKFIKGSKINAGRIPSDDQRRKQSISMTGRTLTNEHKAKIRMGLSKSEKQIGHPKGMPTWNKGISIDASHLHTEEIRRKISIANTGKQISEATKKKLSLIVREWWKNPENAKKALKINSPNKEELKLKKILDSMYPGDWQFVGDGKVVFDGKCPDFINVNGQKKIIELFGERWHEVKEIEDRINFFRPFGFDTLIIWVRELQNVSKTKQMLKAFCEKTKEEK